MAEELQELAELEAAAAQVEEPADEWVQDLLEEAGLAHGFLSFDEA
jgi:hypothetical protein